MELEEGLNNISDEDWFKRMIIKTFDGNYTSIK